MWDAEHERPFSCIDPATASKILVVRGLAPVHMVAFVIVECFVLLQTTRIKGIMPKGLEVELELLGVKGRAMAQTFLRLADMILVGDNRISRAVGSCG